MRTRWCGSVSRYMLIPWFTRIRTRKRRASINDSSGFDLREMSGRKENAYDGVVPFPATC